jgi:hypothetical protein
MTTFKDHQRALQAQGFSLPHAPKSFSDADGAIFFARQLEYIESRVFEVLYQDLKYRQYFPVDSSVPAGVKSIGYWVTDKAGRAKWINTGAKDIPRVDIAGKEVFHPVHWAADSFAYNIGEIESARFAGVALEQRKANAARRVIEELLNETCWFGNADNGLVGFFSAGTGIPSAAAPNAPWTSGTPATPDEIINDVNKLFSDIVVNTREKEKANMLGLDTATYNYIANTRVTDINETIMSYLISKSPHIAGPKRRRLLGPLTLIRLNRRFHKILSSIRFSEWALNGSSMSLWCMAGCISGTHFAKRKSGFWRLFVCQIWTW